MTDEEMRERIKEIDETTIELCKERRKYASYLYEKERQNLIQMHKNDIGKCYVLINNPREDAEYFRAFKIIDVCASPNDTSAHCIVLIDRYKPLIDGYKRTYYREYGVKLETLPVWGRITKDFRTKNDKKLIDFYKEITEEEFLRLYDRFENNVKNARFDRNTGA